MEMSLMFFCCKSLFPFRLMFLGEKWKRSRKLLTPAFHFKIVQSYLQFIPPLTKIFINKLDEQVGKGAFDISKLTSLYTLDVICGEFLKQMPLVWNTKK